ncbi:IS630 family transposase [Candidatus Methylospira mobilis]|uniref:IS630 family transposase n=1 Tax=Candidatus Methylospira mobilis TaxID=1808979 RepID=UPI0028F0787F|nr:IS630 family transposase [Candidatus Methylospira mobilis]WNV05834.1 IS630 family transposase [Candidatus Methylospira mobilis]
MNEDWLKDGRKIPDEVMSYIRKMAVHAVRERGESPETVATIFNFNRHCIYRWLKQYDKGGYKNLETGASPGATPIITAEMDIWLKDIVLNKNPLDYGFDTNLWSSPILAELIKRKFNIVITGDSVSLHLKALGLSYQKPCYRDNEFDPDEAERFLNNKFPLIKRLAEKMGADICFEDEAGVGVRTRCGRTWGLIGETPEVSVSNKRGGYNVLSTVTSQGKMRYSIDSDSIDSERYIEFLGKIIKGRERPVILIADNVSFHKSKQVRDFVGAHRTQIRVFFLPRHAPAMNPDEQVWNEIKNNRIGKQPALRDREQCEASGSSSPRKL